MLTRIATSASPATDLVGHVKEDTARSAAPADRAGCSWERSACLSAGKGKGPSALHHWIAQPSQYQPITQVGKARLRAHSTRVKLHNQKGRMISHLAMMEEQEDR